MKVKPIQWFLKELSSIKSKELSDEVHHYYGKSYDYLNDFSVQYREMFNDIVDYLNDNYKVISTEKLNTNS